MQTQIDEWRAKNGKNIELAILTPCYGGVVHTNYTMCLIQTIELCKRYGIVVSIEFTKNESLVQRARNQLIAKAMFRLTTTHIMFIDSDITWRAEDIIKLILHDREVIGAIYPFKQYNLNVIHDESKMSEIKKRYEIPFNKKMSFEKFFEENLLKFNTNFKPERQQIEKNLLPIKHLATGFMMMKRSCIEKMMDKFPHTKYECDTKQLVGEENKFCYALFDCFIKEGHYYSEDWGFCDRWESIGGDIFCDVTIPLGHSGVTDYRGRLLSTLEIKS